MRNIRIFFALLLAFSVAMLPLPSVFAHAVDGNPQKSAGHAHHAARHASAERSLTVPDCCDRQPCEKRMHDCGSGLACALKCAGVSGALPSGPVMATPTADGKAALGQDQRLATPAENPPLPPPRA
jgi:hypothetical protein